MNDIPELVGYKLESALHILSRYKHEIIVKETFGKKSVKSDEVRIIRQTIVNDNTLKLIIAYF